MEIRNAEEKDIPAIVELLKLSLGESLMPKSEAFWKWKHVDNPFGRSPVLLAVEADKVIGVRAFMRWTWKQGDKTYQAVRAVDTATHPSYHGKGIFKKLTLQLVEQCKEDGVDFIFNTPNKSSKPGYLKMGWQEVGRLPISIRPVGSWRKPRADFESVYRCDAALLQKQYAAMTIIRDQDAWLTHRSSEFIAWRYAHNPTIAYFSLHDPSHTYLVLFRLKPNRFGVEFRVCDFLFTASMNVKHLHQHLFMVAREAAATVITFSGSTLPVTALEMKVGPRVTVRPLSLQNSLSFDFWKPSLGDMEVF